jgi:hypothetical protein
LKCARVAPPDEPAADREREQAQDRDDQSGTEPL